MKPDRVPYSGDLDGGPEIGTCLPPSAHKLGLEFAYERPNLWIWCPEDGCVQTDDPGHDDYGVCWLSEWWDNIGEEMMSDAPTPTTFYFDIDGEGTDDLHIWVTGSTPNTPGGPYG